MTCHVVALHNTYRYLHNEYDYCTNGMQRLRGESLEAQVNGLFFPVLYSQALHKKGHKFLALPIKQMHHAMKGHSGIDRRSIIYFLHRKIMRRYSQRLINDV